MGIEDRRSEACFFAGAIVGVMIAQKDAEENDTNDE